jgi:redox-sensitive bicupin YhaK (pirin superfamily)
MKKIINKANDRGVAEHGWLHSGHSFSFAHYYNPDKMGFGLLRVLNDDIVEPGKGFGTHAHDNMEIISIVLDGALEHKDSMGSTSVINKDDVQVMSAGTGITHSEYNHSKSDKVNFLQLWIIPKEQNITPGYDQRSFPENERSNQLLTVVSGDKNKDALYIHQNAEISLGKLDKSKAVNHKLTLSNKGLYLFVTDGELSVADEKLARRDAIGISDVSGVTIQAETDTKFVLVEVPMS